MRILFVVRQKKNVDTFAGTIRALVERDHSVVLALQEGHDLHEERARDEIASARLTIVRSPAARRDPWADTAPLLRGLRDCAHYLQPHFRDALKLQRRMVTKLGEDLRGAESDDRLASAFRSLSASEVRRLQAILDLAEDALPADPLWTSFISDHTPDVVLVSPLVHFGSAQADVVAAARAAGVPVGMLLFSWDNLSTKGALHQRPDWMFVWNERQRQEAADLHGFDRNRVVVVGAPRFDSFFERQAKLTREEFHQPLGLDPSNPTLLYVCSSAFVAEAELGFVRKWVAAVRRLGSEPLRGCNILVRPHPDISLLSQPLDELRWPSHPGLKALVARPFDDARAIVLRTSDRLMQGLYESIFHSVATVGLNTSAELEAAIAGRPVYTIMADAREAEGQRGTLHFHYLVEGQGGFVKVASSLEDHVRMLDSELAVPTDANRLREFVTEFLRPMGIDRPVSPLLAEAIERTFAPLASRRERQDAAPAEPREAQHDTIAIEAERPRSPVLIAGKLADIRFYTFDTNTEEGRDRYRPDPTTLQWLSRHIGIGEVLYDVGAGIGVYTILAARRRGSIVVACEPGYAAFKLLCDNLRLNGCGGAVIPLPIALADVEGMAELKYGPGRHGHDRHVIRRVPWRVRRDDREDRPFVQPVWTTTLDCAVERFGLPLPNHLRFSEDTDVRSVIAGAGALMAKGTLKSIFVTLAEGDCAAVEQTLASNGWAVSHRKPISRGRVHALLVSHSSFDLAQDKQEMG